MACHRNYYGSPVSQISTRFALLFVLMKFTSPAIAAGDELQIASIGDFQLVSGEVIRDCEIGYRTFGTLNSKKSNIIVMPTWFDGTSKGLLDYELIGPGKTADSNEYFVIAIDALSNGVSSSPSNSPSQSGKDFPVITIADMVESQHRLLTDHLDIDHAKAIIGVSMGGMQTFQWLASYPNFMDVAIPIDGSPKLTSYDIIQWRVHDSMIGVMQAVGHNNASIADAVSQLTLLTLWTPEHLVDTVAAEDVDSFLQESRKSYADFNANNYVSQLRAMLTHNVFGSSQGGRQAYIDTAGARILIIRVAGDHMVNQTPAKNLSDDLDASYFAVDSLCGHMGTTCEAGDVEAQVHAFLR